MPQNIGNLKKENKQEGFWYSEDEPEYPFPKEHTGEWGKDEFLSALIALEDKLMAEYAIMVKKYNEGGKYEATNVESYRGSSECRICKCINGSREFSYNNWKWPEGFRHYIIEHGIKPSDEFILMIRNEQIKTTTEQLKEINKGETI